MLAELQLANEGQDTSQHPWRGVACQPGPILRCHPSIHTLWRSRSAFPSGHATKMQRTKRKSATLRYAPHISTPSRPSSVHTASKNTLVGRATTDRSLLPWTAQNKHVQDLGKVRRGSRRGGHVCTSVRQGLARAKSTGRSDLDGLDGMCTVSLRAYAPPFPTHCSSQHTSNHMGSAGAIAALQQAMWRAGQRSNDLLHALALSLRVCISDLAQPRQASRRWPPSRAGFFAFVDHLLSFYPRTPPPWSSWLACSVSGSSTLAMAPR